MVNAIVHGMNSMSLSYDFSCVKEHTNYYLRRKNNIINARINIRPNFVLQSARMLWNELHDIRTALASN